MAQMTYTRHLARLTLIYAAALWMMAAPTGLTAVPEEESIWESSLSPFSLFSF
jgi:hypothetical protein